MGHHVKTECVLWCVQGDRGEMGHPGPAGEKGSLVGHKELVTREWSLIASLMSVYIILWLRCRKKITRNAHLKLNCVCYSHGNKVMWDLVDTNQVCTSPHAWSSLSNLSTRRQIFTWKSLNSDSNRRENRLKG